MILSSFTVLLLLLVYCALIVAPFSVLLLLLTCYAPAVASSMTTNATLMCVQYIFSLISVLFLVKMHHEIAPSHFRFLLPVLRVLLWGPWGCGS